MKPKIVAKAFWVGECENELRRLNRSDFRFHQDNDMEKALDMIDKERLQSVYTHTDCNELCKSRGTYNKVN